MNVDPVKLLEQEPAFKEFTKDALLGMMQTGPGVEVIKTIYSFYSIGMTVDQVTQFLRTAQSMQGDQK